ncbi:hypothetical protein [Methanofollis sp. UBA420]|uniref:hypothetical protein n=1 Tax=Methanofollis sp. UBA420 TaxID=1915514 RepID=UPI00316AD047
MSVSSFRDALTYRYPGDGKYPPSGSSTGSIPQNNDFAIDEDRVPLLHPPPGAAD